MPTTVEVTINTNGTTHSVAVAPDPVRIPEGVRGPIQWRITNPASDGWKFRTQGIDIKDAGEEFDHPNGSGGRVFTWNNNHNTKAEFKYAVRVSNGTANVDLDPTIINE